MRHRRMVVLGSWLRCWLASFGGAVALLLTPTITEAQAVTVPPYFLIMVDNSGSMTAGTGGGNNSCNRPRTRMSDAKCVLRQVVNGYGDVIFGLGAFRLLNPTGTCTGSEPNCVTTCSGCSFTHVCTSSSPIGNDPRGGQVLVGFAPNNHNDILRWVDFHCSTCTTNTAMDPELWAATWTPIGGAMAAARDYLRGVLASDPYWSCRSVNVIMLTDGDETCGGDAEIVARELRNLDIGMGRRVTVTSYFIGFGISPGDFDIERYNRAGRGIPDGPGYEGFYASDEATLAAAFSQIIADAVRHEVCNGRDDDCDMNVDEGFTLYCNRPAGITTRSLCTDPGERLCDGVDDNCNGQVDEGLLNACGTCGTLRETCNRLDDDCDGAIDEGGVCGSCVPTAESCNNRDDDCDGRVDENLRRPCGVAVGECTVGEQVCTGGMWGACSGRGPSPEVCDNRDNDCDGVVDGFVERCGTDVGECEFGTRQCVAGRWSDCTGGVGPVMERCDALDNDCDGRVDEGTDPGTPCGSSVGVCRMGTIRCVGGMLVCTGGMSGGPEMCNNLDDDCDGRVDEGNPGGGAMCGSAPMMGACRRGVLTCTGGTLVCTGEVLPRSELCNGIDDDCDGNVDEGDPEAGMRCGDDTGECVAGVTRCVGGRIVCEGEVPPRDEVCNGLDDDCDGAVDDGIPVGEACGSDVGECEPGVMVCDPASGRTICAGEIPPRPEACNLLDDDCDGRTDEGLEDLGPCGTDEGVCMRGISRCVEGMVTCVGAVSPSPEVCDCEDNDCDGRVDEADGRPLCPGDSRCVECQCASPCVPSPEFGPQCPTGTEPVEEMGRGCYCLRPRCDPDACAMSTVMVMGEVRCAPGSRELPTCVCKNRECTFPCDGVVCDPPLVCNPRTGRCVENSCLVLGCPPGQVCDPATRSCVSDPCQTAGCAPEQACRYGVCETSCANLSCAAGERCRHGRCEADPCAGVSCGAGEVCDPSSRTCVSDRCVGRNCPEGTFCQPLTGQCEADPCLVLRCPAGQECIRGECREPGWTEPDAGVSMPDAGRSGGIDGGVAPGSEARRILAAGGGGCICKLGHGRGDFRAHLLLLLALFLLSSWRNKRAKNKG